jgi:hypothetical protein
VIVEIMNKSKELIKSPKYYKQASIMTAIKTSKNFSIHPSATHLQPH